MAALIGRRITLSTWRAAFATTIFGEGDYAESEHMIQELLREAGHQTVASGTVFVSGTGVEEAADMKDVESPESISARITLRTSRLLAVPFRTRPTITRPPRHLPSPMGAHE